MRIVHSMESVEHVNQMAVQSQYMRPIHHPLVIQTNSKSMSGMDIRHKNLHFTLHCLIFIYGR